MPDFFEHIDEYIHNQLSEADKQAFEDEMNVNATLRAAVDNYDLVKEISMGFLEAEVRDILNQPKASDKKYNSKRWWWAGILVILLATVAYYLISKNNAKMPVQYADLYIEPAWPVNRGDTADTLSDAIKIALSGNTPSAVLMIKKCSLPDEEKNMWIAEVFAKSGQADSTLFYLPSSSDNKLMRDRINYLRIISLYQQSKNEELKNLMGGLPDNTDVKYNDIYNKIKTDY